MLSPSSAKCTCLPTLESSNISRTSSFPSLICRLKSLFTLDKLVFVVITLPLLEFFLLFSAWVYRLKDVTCVTPLTSVRPIRLSSSSSSIISSKSSIFSSTIPPRSFLRCSLAASLRICLSNRAPPSSLSLGRLLPTTSEPHFRTRIFNTILIFLLNLNIDLLRLLNRADRSSGNSGDNSSPVKTATLIRTNPTTAFAISRDCTES
mmetsp:Transcript_4323/g.5822  ORF Transcript_4323/g.5822 Transcript_4323/m.5822 type:complete len:206 (-) Transcript_4323:646-1263(-)